MQKPALTVRADSHDPPTALVPLDVEPILTVDIEAQVAHVALVSGDIPHGLF